VQQSLLLLEVNLEIFEEATKVEITESETITVEMIADITKNLLGVVVLTEENSRADGREAAVAEAAT